MSLFETTLGMIIIFLIYILISEYFVKRRLKIKRTRNGMFSKGRKKIFIMIEITLIIFFLIITYLFNIYLPIFRGLSVAVYFFFVFLVRGIEEWVVRKSERGYYHEWIASTALLVIILFVTIGEMVFS